MVMVLPITTILRREKYECHAWKYGCRSSWEINILTFWPSGMLTEKTILGIPRKKREEHTEKSSTSGSLLFRMASLTENAG